MATTSASELHELEEEETPDGLERSGGDANDDAETIPQPPHVSELPAVGGASEDYAEDEDDDDDDDAQDDENRVPSQDELDAENPVIASQMELIKNSTPSTALEVAYHETLLRKEAHITRLTLEYVSTSNI
jgi:hypothetical protein